MATKNAFYSNLPVEVAKGGTGASSFTQYAVICGGTTATGALQSVASVGSAAQILTSNGAGALPTFQAAPTTNMVFQVLASDPASPTDGQVWYNSTSNSFKGQKNSTTVTFQVY